MVLFNIWNGKWIRWGNRCKQWLRIMKRQPTMQTMHTSFLKVRLSRTTKPSQIRMSKKTKILSLSFITRLPMLTKSSSPPITTLRWKMCTKSTQALAARTPCRWLHSWMMKQVCKQVKAQLKCKKTTKLQNKIFHLSQITITPPRGTILNRHNFKVTLRMKMAWTPRRRENTWTQDRNKDARMFKLAKGWQTKFSVSYFA